MPAFATSEMHVGVHFTRDCHLYTVLPHFLMFIGNPYGVHLCGGGPDPPALPGATRRNPYGV